MLYITHDLLSARMLADDVLVLNQGELVESGDALSVIHAAKQHYTRRLVDAIPNPYAHVSSHAVEVLRRQRRSLETSAPVGEGVPRLVEVLRSASGGASKPPLRRRANLRLVEVRAGTVR